MTNLFSCFNNIVSGNTPLQINIDEVTTINDCDFIVRSRTEKGWTVDIVFDSSNYTWTGDSIFYYWGISGSTGSTEYIDNNLSFWLTSDRKIKWKSYRYVNESQNIINTDSTLGICSGSTTGNFNITISFERKYALTDCDLLNNGGINDLILNKTVTNIKDTITGATPIYDITYGLNENWSKDKRYRMGTLKIYLNGKPFYKLDNWEEVIPSQRSSTNKLVQLFGTGMTGVGNIHNGNCYINFLEINYYEEPLSFIEINNLFQTKNNIYNFSNCYDCTDSINSIDSDYEFIILEDNNTESYYLLNESGGKFLLED